ncbi:alpha/beta hydrolase family protein [Acinetobacter tianfuensis]|uniref:Alpha/beta fold hydrolase n=1 Tax=Acinetobacter tianfuensis TaxID=2419603 RepID=A0A3A8F1V6_9GAMM|nr:alpha/beta fold hydrolase [Acinetobacter tianfuensis]RKG34673.1 alpha/beta fold hydrolase [Acinetobacter tianfuensis]
MNVNLKNSLLATMCSSALFLTACGGDGGDFTYTKSDVAAYGVDADVSVLAGKHEILTYKMQSVLKTDIDATTLVFIPKGTAPAGGWPVVVWAHGTTGAADKCAPSNNPLDGGEKDLVKELLSRGYAVVAPDYEGLGNTKVAHPYLNLSSAAVSILGALDAANKKYGNLSKNWSVVGWSQGGHAALAAAEFHSALPTYNYKGAVAIAPASYLAPTLENGMDYALGLAQSGPQGLTEAVPIAATLYTYAAIVSSGIKAGNTAFNYNQAFLNDKTSIASQAESLCSPELARIFAGDIQSTLAGNGGDYSKYQALQPKFLDDADIKKYLAENTPAKVKLDKPVVIFQGTADTTVPYLITQQLESYMLSQKTDVRLITKVNETHGTSFSNNIAEISDEVDELMN